MYTPEHFRDADEATAYTFMMAHPFGLAITNAAGHAFISHVPFLVDRVARRVRWHLAVANAQCEQLALAAPTTLVFHGPHAYVSPRWYAQPAVPTWNYVAVHVQGHLRCLSDIETARLVADFSRAYEGESGLGEFEDSKIYHQLLSGIRGFELTVETCLGKRKLSQNRSAADQASVAAKLLQEPGEAAHEIGALMQSAGSAPAPSSEV